MRALLVVLALAVSACASNYEFQQGPSVGSKGTVANPSNEWAQWHYDCALSRMRVDAPGPVPEIRWVNSPWRNYYGQIALGAYIEETNVIYVVHRRNSTEVIVHEMAHAIAAQLGEEISEWRAYKVSDWWHHCLLFGVA